MKISIAMTTYNGIQYIKEQLDSIRQQTLLPDEVIIVDDCSTDETVSFISEYILQYRLKNWKLYLNDTNLGWKENFRKALFLTSGDLVFLADQDDIWEKEKIEELKEQFFREKKAELIISNYSLMYENRKELVKIKNINNNSGILEHLPFNYRSIYVLRPGCTYAIKKNIIDLMRTFDDSSYAHDSILWNIASLRNSLYLYNKQLIRFRRHLSSASTPSNGLDISRRIKEVEIAKGLAEFLLVFSVVGEYSTISKRRLSNIIEFLQERLEILSTAKLWTLVFFQLRYFYYYPTVRNLLSDILVVIKHKNKY